MLAYQYVDVKRNFELKFYSRINIKSKYRILEIKRNRRVNNTHGTNENKG